MLNLTICCDTPNQVNTLDGYLMKFYSSHDFNYKLSKFKSFNDLTNKPPLNIDILLLSVNLNSKQDAFNIYRKLKSLYDDIQIIFIPELIDFVLNGFYLKDFRCILKPLKYSAFEDELLDCLDYLMTTDNHIKKTQFNNNTLNVLNGLSSVSILFIESIGKNCVAYTSNIFVEIPNSIDILEKSLCPSTFFRCHHNYLINIKKIGKLNTDSVIINSKVIPVDKKKFTLLKNKLLVMLKII
ncbi:LytTR family transcriptional regulator DNA-binding domain-containing protein [Romboutsia sedimentorum]|uniref:LytR/AlgR family response regulator transcription factor n=1 Tax=Romboutsia sedimentorum TaxID=1368474 RepID=UPI0024DE33B9|nr:LytTR family transcriptional regulator DNA-binding domain-containing protein [Romboutsia sedimentorum]MDK2585806.1 LytTR family transcriptional regulator DNA-binding domain-containing protein [Romboutsia sedimentorum]